MDDRPILNFANQALQNRSFRGQDLTGADFRNADLRGCDFTGACLVGANLAGAKLGKSPRQWLGLVAVGIITVLVVFYALSRLLFGAMGQTPSDRGWPYFLLLLALSSISGGSIALDFLAANHPRLSRGLTTLAAATSGTMVGFFYAGIGSGQNPGVALIGGVGLAAIATIVNLSIQRVAWTMTIGLAGALAAYTFMMLIGTVALAALTTSHWLLGLACSALAILYAQCVLNALLLTYQTLRQFPGTCFHRANLLQVKFRENAP